MPICYRCSLTFTVPKPMPKVHQTHVKISDAHAKNMFDMKAVHVWYIHFVVTEKLKLLLNVLLCVLHWNAYIFFMLYSISLRQ